MMSTTQAVRPASSEGYTIDQTILIVAIIAILVTLIVITVGWNLIGKTSGTKLTALMRQFEDACGQFYANTHVWPDEAYTTGVSGNPAHDTALVLVAFTTGMTYLPRIANADFHNYIVGLRADTGGVRSPYGYGTNPRSAYLGILRQTNPTGLKGVYLVLYIHDVPFSEVKEAKQLIDGDTTDFGNGRVTAALGNSDNWVTDGSPPVAATTGPSTAVNVSYVANQIQ